MATTNTNIFAAHFKDQAALDNNFSRALVIGAKGLAFMTGLKISACSGNMVHYCTPNGLPVGTLTTGRKNEYSEKAHDIFVFRSAALVQRDRAPAGHRYSERDLREGKTIKGLVQAMKKCDKTPTEENVMNHLAGTLKDIFVSPMRSVAEARIRLDTKYQLPLVMQFLGIDKYTVMQDEGAIRRLYEQYITDNKAYIEARDNAVRLCIGSTIIGCNRLTGAGPYIIGKARVRGVTADTKKLLDYGLTVEFTEPMMRHEELPEEFGGIAAITKAYMEGSSSGANKSSPFGLHAHVDLYHDAVDIAQESSQYYSWVAIPTDIAEGAPVVYTI